MPYPNNEALPDAIKSALPDAAQTIFRNAFNNPDGDEAEALQGGWVAVKNAGYEKQADGKWVKVEKNTAEFTAEIFSVGTWNGHKYTQDDLDEIVKADKALSDHIKPPLKLGHNSQQPMKDGMFALGWVKPGSLYSQAGKLFATFSQVPDVIVNAIKKGLYKRVSSEIYWNYKRAGKVYKRVLAGVALLGADIPAVSNLADLDKYLAQAPDDGSFDAVQVYSIEVDDTGSIKTDKGDDMSEYKEKFEAEETARKAAEAQSKKDAADLKKFKDDQAKKDKTASGESFKTFCEYQVKEGKMTPAARDILTKDTEKLCYTIDDGFSISVESFKEFMEQQGKLLPTKEGGKSDKKKEYADVQEEVDAKVKKYQADHKEATYQEALDSVFDADEALAKAYINDTPIDHSDDE